MFLKYFSLFSPIIFVVTFLVLGIITPGYDPMARTISRLAIEKYGIIQQLNFIQFAAGLFASGKVIIGSIQNKDSREFIRKSSYICSAVLLLMTVFPINYIEDTSFSFSLLTTTGIMHAFFVVFFLCLTSFGIYKLYVALKKEAFYRSYSSLSLYMGYIAFFWSVAWLLFLSFNLFPSYRGLLQKLLTMFVILWLELINLKATKIFDIFSVRSSLRSFQPAEERVSAR